MLQDFYASRAKSDLDKHLSYAHEECVFRVVGTERLDPLTKSWNKVAEVRQVARELFDTWDMSQVQTISTHQCGDTVYVHRRGKVIYRRDGSGLETEFLDKLTFKDERIIEYLQFVDTFAISEFLREKMA